MQQSIPILQFLLASGWDIEYANEMGVGYFASSLFNDTYLEKYGEHGVQIVKRLPPWFINKEHIATYKDFRKISSLKFPILKLSKLEMYNIGCEYNFNDLLHYT